MVRQRAVAALNVRGERVELLQVDVRRLEEVKLAERGLEDEEEEVGPEELLHAEDPIRAVAKVPRVLNQAVPVRRFDFKGHVFAFELTIAVPST